MFLFFLAFQATTTIVSSTNQNNQPLQNISGSQTILKTTSGTSPENGPGLMSFVAILGIIVLVIFVGALILMFKRWCETRGAMVTVVEQPVMGGGAVVTETIITEPGYPVINGGYGPAYIGPPMVGGFGTEVIVDPLIGPGFYPPVYGSTMVTENIVDINVNRGGGGHHHHHHHNHHHGGGFNHHGGGHHGGHHGGGGHHHH